MTILRKLPSGVLLFLMVLLVQSLLGSKSTGSLAEKHSINLRARSTILGPHILLGDITTLMVTDSLKRMKLSAIKIGKAAPPGESTEILLSHIKKKLMHAGFGEYADSISGPRTIRVLTAQKEIDKAFVREGLVAFPSVIMIYRQSEEHSKTTVYSLIYLVS